jgi:hypothetical protein
LLLPIYSRYLSPSDYGLIAMLLTVEAVTKIAFRWGVDTAFVRMYYDCSSSCWPSTELWSSSGSPVRPG